MRAVLDRFPGAEIVAVRDRRRKMRSARTGRRRRRCSCVMAAFARPWQVVKENFRPDHRAPHVGDGRIVEAEAFLRLLEVAADDILEFLRIDLDAFLEGIEIVERDRARAHIPAMLARGLVVARRDSPGLRSPVPRSAHRRRDTRSSPPGRRKKRSAWWCFTAQATSSST